ncbi:Protein YIF1B-B [Lamellibrachia satsuma]|nr:Protein YIF1B-B [Lamellibrachia satsuma]
MNLTGPRHPSEPKHRGASRNWGNANPQLFDDTSTAAPPAGYDQQQPFIPQPVYEQSAYGQPSGYDQQYTDQGNFPQFSGQQLLNDPMANIAMSYGQTLADQGTDYVHKNIEKYVSTSKLKYYFAVDTSYVGKKLGLLVFPFAHSDWSIRFDQDSPVAPRFDINAPDLYIPGMAFVTYILLAGVVLGTQNRFTPEQLGILASTALVWLVIEILLLLLVTYLMSVSTDLKYLDLLAYCGYKYVGMILSLAAGMVFRSTGYYLMLAWTSITIAFFLIRSLKFAIIPYADRDSFTRGNKRRLYTLLSIALSQPFFMWCLTCHLVAK